MLRKNAAVFLKSLPPFRLLDEQSLGRLIGHLIMELYPDGSLILKQGEPTSRGLYIIREGRVKISARTSPDLEQTIDYRDSGQSFGFLSLAEDELLDVSVQADGDTICYVLGSAQVTELLDEHPSLREYLIPSYFPKQGNKPAGTPSYPNTLPLGSDRVLFTTTVIDIACRDVFTVRDDVSIREAARLMSTHRIGAVVVVNEAGRPEGIVTSSDLRDRVLIRERELSDPVCEIASSPLVTVDASDLCFEALLKMMSHELHHLVVLDAGRLAGIVSNHDFLILQGISPYIMVREVEDQGTVEGLASTSGKVRGLIAQLLREGAGAGSILRIVTTVNDRIERRILDLALKTLGPSPVSFCWIVFGSSGRKEQTFITDQDNAIIYVDPADEEEGVWAEEYFGRFAEFVVDAGLRCGFKLCRGNFMASFPHWRQPLSAWEKRFSSWIMTPTKKAIHNSANLFDFRGLHGDMRLATALKEHLMYSLRNQQFFLNAFRDKQFFLKAFADYITDYRPPLGMFGSLMFEKDGDHADHLNLKDKCLTPLINIIRLFSFECNIPETSTLERIAVLKDIHPVMKKTGEDLQHAFEFISLLRIRHQLEQAASDIVPDNFIAPKHLSSLELRNLTEILKLIDQLIDGIAKKYAS
ncbi:MAG: CBS domain-containing protein [Nitrospirae bacterium]|nr:MAG: CBS domain-containing protein [Nitrospirota bacterium]